MGANTTKKYFYLPALGASGQAELDLYNAGQERADSQMPIFPQAYATGTGTSGDPWAGWQAAAYAACPTGGTIYFRAGYYALSATLTLAKAINIIGEGMSKVFITTIDDHGITVTGDYVTLKGFTVDGAAQTDGLDYHSCIAIDTGADYPTLEDIEVKNAGYYGMNIFESNYGMYQNIYAHDNYRHGVHPGSDTAGKNIHNTYRNIYTWNNTQLGFADRGCSVGIENAYNVFDNIQAWGNGTYGIEIALQKGGTLSNAISSGNTTKGISLNGLEDFTVNNCWSSGNTTQGINCFELVHVSINNCLVTGNGGSTSQGLFLQDCEDVNLTNVIVKNNYTGIGLNACAKTTLTSCQSYDDRVTPLQRFGLQVTGAETETSLINCKLSPNALGVVYDAGDTSITSMMRGIKDDYEAVAGDIIYHNGTNWVKLAKGTANQYLKMNGAATAPVWVS